MTATRQFRLGDMVLVSRYGGAFALTPGTVGRVIEVIPKDEPGLARIGVLPPAGRPVRMCAQDLELLDAYDADPCVDCDDDTCAVCHNEGRDVDHIEIRDAFGNVLKSWDEPADPSYPFNDDEIRTTWDMLTGHGVKLPRWRAALVRIGDWARTVKP